MLKIVWKFKQNMAKSHKTCMEQAEIIDTFGTYQMLSSRASLASSSVYKACRGESNSMSDGMTASDPYTRKKGVNPVDRFGVVLRLNNTVGSSSIHAPGALSSGSTNRGLIPDKMRQFALST